MRASTSTAASTTRACCAPASPTSAVSQPGRVDHHDAGGAQLLPLHREDLHPQDLRGAAGVQDREPAEQGADPRGVHEPDLPRRAYGFAARPARSTSANRSRTSPSPRPRCWPASRGAVGLQPDRQPKRDRAAAVHHRPHAGKRLHQRRPARRGQGRKLHYRTPSEVSVHAEARGRGRSPADLQPVRREAYTRP